MGTIMNFMIKDTERAIKEGCNYLVALGLSAYTEIVGGLCYRNLQSNYKQNYDRFLENYFDDLNGCEYMKVDKQLRHLGGLYGVVRVGFVHKYLLTGKGFVATYSPTPLKCAILYNPGGDPEIQFVVSEYFSHFKCALEYYYSKLINERDPHLIENFDLAVTRASLL